MRARLDLDETILAAARSLARSRRISLDAAVSELARRGLRATTGSAMDFSSSPFPVMVGGDVVVTDELVAEFRDG